MAAHSEKKTLSKGGNRIPVLALAFALLASIFSGCTATDGTSDEAPRGSLTIAYEISPGLESLEGNPQLLADHLSESTKSSTPHIIATSTRPES